MTLAAVAALPAAPLLVPGLCASLPDGVAAVCDAVDAVAERLPDPDALLLVVASEAWAVHPTADADLRGIGRPDIARAGTVDRGLLEVVAGALEHPAEGGPMPLEGSVLALLLGDPPPLVALSVPRGGAFAELSAAGGRTAAAVAGRDQRVVVVAAGDLSAGLAEHAPLHAVEGAREFDARVVDALDAGRLDVLASLGPAEAQRVGARGWAPLAFLHGVCERAKLGLARRLYAAPRGVGYLVAYGA